MRHRSIETHSHTHTHIVLVSTNFDFVSNQNKQAIRKIAKVIPNRSVNLIHPHIFWLRSGIVQFWVTAHLITVKPLGNEIPKSGKVLHFGRMIGNTASREDKYELEVLLTAFTKKLSQRDGTSRIRNSEMCVMELLSGTNTRGA